MKRKKVYVVGGGIYYANWLNFDITNTMENADLVLFTGGEDVDPSFYKERANPKTSSNIHRDRREIMDYVKALDLKIPMLGICRGSQFLCVMNGGRLVQHQENKYGVHPMETTYGRISITSTHHQAAFPFNLPTKDYKILGWTNGISSIHENGYGEEMNPPVECEIVYYPKTRSLGIQGHPEQVMYQKTHPDSIEVLKVLFDDFINDKLQYNEQG